MYILFYTNIYFFTMEFIFLNTYTSANATFECFYVFFVEKGAIS